MSTLAAVKSPPCHSQVKMAIAGQAVLLTYGSWLPRPTLTPYRLTRDDGVSGYYLIQRLCSVSYAELLPVYSGGTVPAYTGLPY